MKAARASTAAGVALLGTILGEIALARRTPPGGWHEGFPHDLLDGRYGDGGRFGDDAAAVRFAWLGDSTGDGVGASAPERTMPRLVAEGLGQPVELRVLAVSGARAADVEGQAADLAAFRPDLVAIGVGVNDVTHLTGRARFRVHVARTIQAARDAGATRIVVVGVPDMGMFRRLYHPLRALAAARATALDVDLRQVAGAQGAVFVDAAAAMRAVHPADRARFFASDGFHPGDLGYRSLADAVLGALAHRA